MARIGVPPFWRRIVRLLLIPVAWVLGLLVAWRILGNYLYEWDREYRGDEEPGDYPGVSGIWIAVGWVAVWLGEGFTRPRKERIAPASSPETKTTDPNPTQRTKRDKTE